MFETAIKKWVKIKWKQKILPDSFEANSMILMLSPLHCRKTVIKFFDLESNYENHYKNVYHVFDLILTFTLFIRYMYQFWLAMN